MIVKVALILLLCMPLLSFSQEKVIKGWQDYIMQSEVALAYDSKKRQFSIVAEKHKRENQFGVLAKGSSKRMQEVIGHMQSAFHTNDTTTFVPYGRYRYSYTTVPVKDFVVVEMLKIEDLIKDDAGKSPVYLLSEEMLASISVFLGNMGTSIPTADGSTL